MYNISRINYFNLITLKTLLRIFKSILKQGFYTKPRFELFVIPAYMSMISDVSSNKMSLSKIVGVGQNLIQI